MDSPLPADPKLLAYFDAEADAYLKSLPMSHFMEATAQSTQRKITLESFDLIHAMRPEVQCFNELLIQYPRPRRKDLGKVVPDNFVLVHREPIEALKSFNSQVQPVGPLLVLEYVSKHSERKDYDDNLKRYEKELKVPYYLVFYPDADELTLFKLRAKGYSAVRPNAAGRLAIPELELEAALLDGWVRFWFRGELLPLPGDLLRRLTAMQDQLAATQAGKRAAEQGRIAAEQGRAAAEQARAVAEQRIAGIEAENARLREELARAKRGGG